MDATGVAYGRRAAAAAAAPIEPGDYYSKSGSSGAPNNKPTATGRVGKGPSNRPGATTAGKGKEQGQGKEEGREEEEVDEVGVRERERGGAPSASASASAGGGDSRVSREFFERHR